MVTFGSIVNKDQADIKTADTPRPIYSESLEITRRPLTAADLEVQAAVQKVDDAHNMWIDAWNGRAPAHVTDNLWRAYQDSWSAAQDIISRCWYNGAGAGLPAP